MTAFNIIVQPQAAYLITDTVVYLEDGSVTGFSGKVMELTDAFKWPAAFALNGSTLPVDVAPLVEAHNPKSAPALLHALPDILRGAMAAARRRAPYTDPFGAIGVAWWDADNRRARGHLIASDDRIFHPGSGYIPYRVAEVRNHASVEHDQMFGKVVDLSDPLAFNVERDAGRLLDQQRLELQPIGPGGEGRSIIGGEGILTTVAGPGYPSHVKIREWPDEIGGPIRLA